jgi:hypothetical protein
MAVTANFSLVTSVLSLVADNRYPGSDKLSGDNDRLIWNLGDGIDSMECDADLDTAPLNVGVGLDAFTITATSGQVRVFRAFLDQPRYQRPRRQRLG